MATEKNKVEKAEKKVRVLEIPLPEELYESALEAYAQMTRGRVTQAAQQQNRVVDPEELNKITNEEIVVKTLRQQILSTLERKVSQDAVNKLKESY